MTAQAIPGKLFAATIVCLLAGCANEYHVQRYSAVPASAMVADSQGWYRFAGLSFKGTLKDGKPDGIGYCRNSYNLNGYDEMKESPCEFKNGERIDDLHKMRMQQVAANMRDEQRQEDRDRRDAENQRRREREESVRATDAAMRAGLTQFQQNLNAAAAQDRAYARQTQQLYNDGIRQKQEQADNAAERKREQQRADREAKEAAATRDLMARAQTKPTQLASADKAQTAAKEAERAAEQKRKEQEAQQLEEKRRKDALEKAQLEEKRKQKLALEKAEREKKEEQEKAANRIKEGCFVPPRYPVQCVVVDKTKMNKDEFTVTYRNNCEGRVYMSFCNMHKDGSADCGADGVRQGGKMSWQTYNATGAYAYKYTGSRKAEYDWVCGDENHDPEFHRQDLKRELGAK